MSSATSPAVQICAATTGLTNPKQAAPPVRLRKSANPTRIRINLDPQLIALISDFSDLLQNLKNNGVIKTHKIKRKASVKPIAFQLLLIGGIKTLIEEPDEFSRIVLWESTLLSKKNVENSDPYSFKAAIRGLAEHHKNLKIEEVVLAYVHKEKRGKKKPLEAFLIEKNSTVNSIFEQIAGDLTENVQSLAQEEKLQSKYNQNLRGNGTQYIMYSLMLLFGVKTLFDKASWFAAQAVHFTSWLDQEEKVNSELLDLQNIFREASQKHRTPIDEVELYFSHKPRGFKCSKVNPQTWEDIVALIHTQTPSSAIARQVEGDFSRQNIDHYKKRLQENPEYTPIFSRS